MNPSFSDLFFFSRYMLPLWVSGGVWLWQSGRAELIWSRLSENDRGLFILFFCGLVVAALKVCPKVWAYEQARRDYAAAGRDPEALKRRRRFMVRLLAVAVWGGSLWWVREQSYAGNPELYEAALAIAAAGSLWGLVAVYSRFPVSLKSRLRRSRSREQERFIVGWTLPIPKRTPDAKAIRAGLPDYCKLLLASGQKRPQPGGVSKVLKVVGA